MVCEKRNYEKEKLENYKNYTKNTILESNSIRREQKKMKLKRKKDKPNSAFLAA